ncbi:hypothetical protein ROZALSC1DRAFT_31929 [Rozella allomycis CSF55]|uniref:Uncharacterized protein n=1 Tax=Rozella allomycis (strain CSF55) TaxID=988480 RepID=A0A075AZA0_ROZAC|nr:hypothetical protein O9G_005011 [Rozella allomycis CSF55]RKP15871.1 hypothetical protein ROZALSC1DRAFT_31929 [Rozella allomycis CSF55]|eukprot:EPZ35474.1 hypothetical protein O9G_005011 [Rozella allomycis CSF55]
MNEARLHVTKETIEMRPKGSNKTWATGTAIFSRFCDELNIQPIANTLNVINFTTWLKTQTNRNGNVYSANSIKSYTQAVVDLNKLHAAEGKCTAISQSERELISQAVDNAKLEVCRQAAKY